MSNNVMSYYNEEPELEESTKLFNFILNFSKTFFPYNELRLNLE